MGGQAKDKEKQRIKDGLAKGKIFYLGGRKVKGDTAEAETPPAAPAAPAAALPKDIKDKDKGKA